MHNETDTLDLLDPLSVLLAQSVLSPGCHALQEAQLSIFWQV